MYRIQAFVNELSCAIGTRLQPPVSWPTFGSAQQSAASGSSSSSGAAAPVQVETSEQMKDMQFQARKLGFIVGAYAVCKQSSEPEMWWITNDTKDVAIVAKLIEGHVAESKEVPWVEMVEKWKVHKGKVTAVVDPLVGGPMQSVAWEIDGVKSAITIALRYTTGLYTDCLEKLELLQHPTMVKTTAGIGKGMLKLVPSTQRVEKAKTMVADKNAIPVGTFEIKGSEVLMQLAPQFIHRLDSKGEVNKAPWVAPFWAVPSADDKNLANLVLQHETVDIMGYCITIPVLTNPKPLKRGDFLYWDKKAAVASQPAPKKRRTS